jgi:hypothetical protein
LFLKLASRPILLAGEEIQKLAYIHSVLYPNVKQLLRGTSRATTESNRQETGYPSRTSGLPSENNRGNSGYLKLKTAICD